MHYNAAISKKYSAKHLKTKMLKMKHHLPWNKSMAHSNVEACDSCFTNLLYLQVG